MIVVWLLYPNWLVKYLLLSDSNFLRDLPSTHRYYVLQGHRLQPSLYSASFRFLGRVDDIVSPREGHSPVERPQAKRPRPSTHIVSFDITTPLKAAIVLRPVALAHTACHL